MNNHGSILCPHCDSQIESGDIYCDNCGNQLPNSPTATVGLREDKLTRPIEGETALIIGDETIELASSTPVSSEENVLPKVPEFVGEERVAPPQGRTGSPKKIALVVGASLVVLALVGTSFYFWKGQGPSQSLQGVMSSELNKDSGGTSTGGSSNAVINDDLNQPTKQGLIAAPDESGKIAYFNSYGEKLKPGTYEDGDDFVEGYANVRLRGKWGLIDKSFNVVLDYSLQGIRSVHEGMVAVKINGKLGCLDLKDIKDKKHTRLVIPAEYDNVGDFSNGFVVVTKGNRDTFLNKSGNPAFPDLPELEKAWPFSEGVAAVKLAKPASPNEALALIDTNGKIIATFPGKTAGKFSEGVMPVYGNDETWYLDKNLKRVLGPYEYGENFSNGVAAIDEGGKLGFIDRTGKFVIPCQYEYSDYGIRYGVIGIIGEKYLFLDKTGKVIWEGGKLGINN